MKSLVDLAKKGAKKLLVFSPAFVADCLETIIEIGDEYQELFEEHGGEKVQLVESLNSSDTFVHGLKEMILKRSPFKLHQFKSSVLIISRGPGHMYS